MEARTNFEKLSTIFESNEGFISREDVNNAEIPSWFLSDFVKRNELIRIAPGFYAGPDYPIDDYFIIQKRYPKFIFSGMSALYLNNLTDKIPASIYVTAPQGYHPSRNKDESLVIYNVSNEEIYNLGITNLKTMFGNEVRVYGREKTICDIIKRRDKYDGETFIKAVKIYAKSNPNQTKLFKYARSMGIEKKVFEIMEIIMNEN